MKDKQLLDKVYTTPKKFAECIDTIFSNNVNKIAHYFGVKADRDNISVDMLTEWLKNEGTNYAETIGFVNAFYENHRKIQELKSDLKAEIQRLEKEATKEKTASEEELKLIVALECYSRVLNQLDN